MPRAASLPAGEDHSIAELFVQFAEEGLSSGNAELRRSAAALSADVVPAYLAAIAPARSTSTASAPRPPSRSRSSAGRSRETCPIQQVCWSAISRRSSTARSRSSSEEYGNSPMATRFGVRRYPVVFVDDVLVARPKDFGFGGADDVSGGLYVPWLDPANQRKFKDDLATHGRTRRLAASASPVSTSLMSRREADASDGAATLPSLDAYETSRARPSIPLGLSNRPVVVEMWATWCPPCRSTMAWLPSLQKKYGDRATVIAIAVDSKLGGRAEDGGVVQGELSDRDGHARGHQGVRRAWPRCRS